ncbi:hypothetical protein LEP1GSC060_3670 [Leptospira weilii serovar Ranarum str. ICFT]|uniref:Uncharacterized protein n=1 Tax=Leptospira weilii serovar Ranarum str. ICFT TaxID=1218598 RepID=N1WPQ0_9LEPT|nr:hypothetical protein LEP1GSC060_3670 [Leptospira weilii serovar Ranarum str. ICFT]
MNFHSILPKRSSLNTRSLDVWKPANEISNTDFFGFKDSMSH